MLPLLMQFLVACVHNEPLMKMCHGSYTFSCFSSQLVCSDSLKSTVTTINMYAAFVALLCIMYGMFLLILQRAALYHIARLPSDVMHVSH